MTWLMSSLIRLWSHQSGPTPVLRTRAWTVIALVLPVVAAGLLSAPVALGMTVTPTADALSIASAITSCASLACLTTVVPIWLARLSSRDSSSRIIDLCLWAIPAVLSAGATVGAYRLVVLTNVVGGGDDSDAVISGGVALLFTPLLIGIMSTCWGLRLSIERMRRRRGWRPAEEVIDERLAEQERTIAENDRAIDLLLAMPEPQTGEMPVCEVITERPSSPWTRLIATDQRLLLAGETDWWWRDHGDLLDVRHSHKGGIHLTYNDGTSILVEEGDAGMEELGRYLDSVVAR